MHFSHDEQDIDSRDVLRGIYPILNIEPMTEIDALLDWACGLYDVGVRIVQVRFKYFDEDKIAIVLDEIVNQLRGSGLTVILNDFIELVGITGADGVHLGLEDYPIVEARAILGNKAIIGVTCRNYTDALLASGQGASYVAAGSIFKSPTKPGAPVIGLDGLKLIVNELDKETAPKKGWGRFNRTPVCAIGGINESNLNEVISAGASMVAVISSVQGAKNPLESAKKLVEKWEGLTASKSGDRL